MKWRVRDQRLEEEKKQEEKVGGWTVLLVCSSLRASLMHSQAGPRGSKFALRSKLAEHTHGAAGDPSVSLLLLAASSDGGGLS